MHHKGKVVSRTELIEHIYDQDFDRDFNTIEVFVTRIRKKLGAGTSSRRSEASATRWRNRLVEHRKPRGSRRGGG